MTTGLTILIVGGYGIFGGRIVRLLESERTLTLIVSGRSAARASAFVGTRRDAKARLIAAAFDRDGDIAGALAKLRPDILVDASGPFQQYGAGKYRVVEACLAQKVSYLDLADGSDFVTGIAAYDAAARANGLFLLSGVSSFPVLTAAVVRHLAANMSCVDTITGGIAPSPFAGVGENVIRAIASYAGQRIALRRDGATADAYPLTDHKYFTIAPPGHLPLPRTWFSLVDVPDLTVLAALWPEAKTIWMGAGPVPVILHRALAALAWLVRLGLVRGLVRMAPLLHFVTNHVRWGANRGGMFVSVTGVDQAGAAVERSWHLVAEGEDGPLIPAMAVAVAVRNVLAGRPPESGARACAGDLELSDYAIMFLDRTIVTGERNGDESLPLYHRILGTAWAELPAAIRVLHDNTGTSTASGRASVERGRGLLARLTAAMIGFPPAASSTPVSVRFEASKSGEIWTRTFGAATFSSRQFAGRGASERLICERFGVLTFAMALVLDNGTLSLRLRRWSVFGIPLPMWLCPRSTAHETVTDGRFHFDVDIGHKFTGLIVRYRGWLELDHGDG